MYVPRAPCTAVVPCVRVRRVAVVVGCWMDHAWIMPVVPYVLYDSSIRSYIWCLFILFTAVFRNNNRQATGGVRNPAARRRPRGRTRARRARKSHRATGSLTRSTSAVRASSSRHVHISSLSSSSALTHCTLLPLAARESRSIGLSQTSVAVVTSGPRDHHTVRPSLATQRVPAHLRDDRRPALSPS